MSDAEGRKQAETARNLWNRFTGWLGDRFRKMPEPPLSTVEARQKALAVREAQFREVAEGLAEKVYSGEITVAEWQAAMKSEVKSLLVDSTVIGAGGDRTLVAAREWGATEKRCKREFALLVKQANFGEPITPANIRIIDEGHRAFRISSPCPLTDCNGREADEYTGHGGLLVCRKCHRTYDPELD